MDLLGAGEGDDVWSCCPQPCCSGTDAHPEDLGLLVAVGCFLGRLQPFSPCRIAQVRQHHRPPVGSSPAMTVGCVHGRVCTSTAGRVLLANAR